MRSVAVRATGGQLDLGGVVCRSRGRPPLRPFLRAASALAAEVRRPPWRPSSASHSAPGNTEETSPGTLRSRSRLSQCSPPPRPRTATARRSLGLTPLRLGISLTGNVMVAPLVSSMRNACFLSAVCHAGRPRLGNSCKASSARGPSEVRTQLLLYPVGHQTDPDLSKRISSPLTKRLGYTVWRKCLKFTRGKVKEFP